MKKLLIAALLLSSAMVANAQDDEDYATSAGTFSTEIQFNPFSGKNVFTNGGAFSGTYFITDKSALTFSVGLNGTNNKTQYYHTETGEKYYADKNYEGEFSIGIGYKYYFYNYKRINLYAGCNANYIHKFVGEKTQWEDGDYTWNNDGTGNGFSVYANTGIDFSIYKGLYVGAEINVGVKDILHCGYTAKSEINGVKTETKYTRGGHDLEGGFSVSPMFRLGWRF